MKEKNKNFESKFWLLVERLGFVQRLSEARMFVMTIAFAGIALFYQNFWPEFWRIAEGDGLLIFVFVIFGMFYSVYHVFSKGNRTHFQEIVLKYYSAVALGLAAYSSAVYIFQSKQFGYIIFSIWSWLQAAVLILLSRENIHKLIILPQRQAELLEVVFGVVVTAAVLGVEKYYLNAHWSIALSSVLVVWSIIDEYFTRKCSLIGELRTG